MMYLSEDDRHKDNIEYQDICKKLILFEDYK